MRKNYFRSFLFSSVVILGITSINAQEKEQLIKQKIAGSNGNPTLIVFNKSSNYNLNQSKQILKEQLNLGQYDDFRKIKSENDKIGYTHQKNQQYYKGVKVEFGTYTLHSKKGVVESISGEFYQTNNVKITPILSKGQAFQSALSHIGAQAYLWEDAAASKELGYKKPEGELVLLPVFDNFKKKGEVEKLKLAYKFEIFTIRPMGGADVYVDAQNGNVLFYNARVKHVDNFGHDGREYSKNTSSAIHEDLIETFSAALVAGSAQTRYSGTQTIETASSGAGFTLNDASRQVYTRNANNLAPSGSTLPYITNYTEFTDNDNNWTAAEYDNANKDNAALDAHWGAMKTYDYWQNVHGRNSYDNAGAQLRSYVHVDNNYDNAFWFLNVMSYGDGSSNGTEGNGFFDALTSIDVAAHEIGHAVTEFTANLAYQRESGAMNEGFSDIWGAAVEHFAKGNGNDAAPDASIWLIGDEIDRRTGSAALRSMSDPKLLGQPDTYGGTNWVDVNCGTPTSTNDYCGVHTNSGVLNYWFYLLTAGGSGTNDVGGSYNVSGIGMAKAGNLAYRLESVYLSANSTFADARASAIQSAIDLYGAASAEEIAVTNAWHAVGVGNAYGDTTANYCASASTNVNDEYISRVQLNTIDNTSAGQFYSDFTAVSTDLEKSTQYTITITPTWPGTVYDEGYAVWVDYNQNGDFTDAGELVFSKAASKTTPVSGSFTIPSTATDGATRMRVSLKYNGIPTACESFTYGEVEDYTINIGSVTGDTEAPTAPTSLAASVITETTATLTWSASTDNVGVTGYDVFQGATNIGTVTGTTTNITGLTASTNYSFTVKAKDAAGNISASSNSVTFTTSAAPDTQAPSAPSSLATSNITQTSVDLSWTASTDNVGVTGYDVYQDGTNVSTVTGTSTSISGLTANTNYSFYVIAKDAAGNSSTASNTVNATTLSSGGGSGCTSGITAFPYNEGFENTLGAWTQSTADDINWTIDANGTPSSGTGPSTASQGSYYLYVEASGNGTGYPNKQAILNSPCFDLSTETDATFSFKYHMFGDPDMGSIALEASNDNGITWSSIWSETGNKGDAWLTANVNLSAYVGGSVQLRFNRITGATWKADIAIDDISLSAGGATGGGDTTVALSITFDNYPEETSWEILDSANLIVASGGTYASQADGSTLNINVNLPVGCYSFIMKDSFGDGMCCTYGNGSYTLTDTSSNQVLASGAAYTNSETTGFCVGGATAINGINSLISDTTISNGVELTVYPNPVNATLNVSLLGAEAQSYKVINTLGQVVLTGRYSETIDVSKLNSDIYLLQINIGEKVKIKRFLKK